MKNQRQQYEVLRGQLDLERSSFLPHWRDLAEFIAPRRPRFTITDVNSGERRSSNIIDGSATYAMRTLRSGMMSGVTSPARQWFRLSMPDPELSEFGPVKDWLYTVGQRMSTIFLKSNLYNSLPIVYGDMGTFATGAMLVEEDEREILRTFPIPIGSYFIANNEKLQVETFMRDFQMTVYQIVEKFGRMPNGQQGINWENISSHVKSLWDSGETEARIDVCHCIHKNEQWQPGALQSKFKKYKSVYYERGNSGNPGATYMMGSDSAKMLRESGYDFFPILAPRWEVTGEDSWGNNCPGMEALGDIRQLQFGERKQAKAIDKMIDPPMTGPTSLRNAKTTILPGDVTFVDDRSGGGFRAAHEVRFDINALEMKQQQIRQRISRAFFEDLFLMLANSDRRQITAREIDERHEEKLLALGPVLEQLNQDLLDPLIDIGFSLMQSRGLIPPPPEEIAGQDLKVEYISLMAQAQKMIGIGSIERFAGFASQVIAVDPTAAMKVDTEQMLDVYADILSVPPGIIRTDEAVADMKAQQEQAAQARARAEQIPQMAMAAKDLSQTELSGDTALNRIVEAAASGAIQQ